MGIIKFTVYNFSLTICSIHGPRHAILSEEANKLKLFLKKCRPPWLGEEKNFYVLEALKTADWRLKIGDKKFRSGFSSFIWKRYKNG